MASRWIIFAIMFASNFLLNLTIANCVDGNEQCRAWAGAGECEANPDYMLTMCQLSCGTCVTFPCADEDLIQCPLWARRGECEENPQYMMEHCKRSCYICPAYK